MVKPNIDSIGDTYETIVVFEFTGWNCPYCYLGHEAISELEDFYPDRIKAIAIHAGGFAEPGNDGPDYRCETSNALFQKFGSPGEFPTGAINSLNGFDLDSPTAWSSIVSSELTSTKNSPEVYLELNISHSVNTVNANIIGKFATDLEGTYNLCAYIIEKGIIAPQNKLGTIIEEYEHQNVLRGSMVNGIIGENVSINPNSGKVFGFEYSFEISDPEWIVDSLEVIPFLYNIETNYILKTKYIKPKTE
jgi:thiol-disulfide isomerase/thioredoxin